MTAIPITQRRRALEMAGVLARWGLGALFVYMGLTKALRPELFLKLIRQYDLVHSPFMLNTVAACLPWFEAFCGLLLLTGVAVRGTALTLVSILIPFTALVWRRALVLRLLHGLPFCAVKFDCGCGAGEAYICRKLAENVFLLIVSAGLVWGWGRTLCARHGLFGRRTDV